MNPILKAVSDIKFKIPMDLLQAAFIRLEFGDRVLPVNLDYRIRQEILDGKVRPDCDLVGGIEVEVPLGGLRGELVDTYLMVFRIPKSLTRNRLISRVLSVSMGSGQVPGTVPLGAQGYSHVLGAAEGVMAAMTPIPIVSTAHVRLIGENTILIADNLMFPSNAYLRCYVENDADFSHLRSTTYHKFSQLMLLATKAFIYNRLVINTGLAQLVGGQELGRFREILDGYADASDLYDTYLEEVWRRVAIMDDTTSRERHLRMLLPRR